ncbi:MAG: enoyl-CoA hydratase/isomerase family protein, partial [Acidimicrobiia bacterium]
VFTGRQVGAEEALDIGYADKVASVDEILDMALADAADWATKPTVALGAAKRALNQGWGRPIEEGMRIEQEAFQESFATDDAVEGVNAFVEKKEAIFKGS